MNVDDTLHARADTLLQQTLLGDAAEHSRLGVMVWNEELRYVAVNRAAAELLASTREELLGSRVGDVNPTEGARQAIDAVLSRLPATGRTPLARGGEVEWIVDETKVAGLRHFFGILWRIDSPDN
jgi:PAS domain-containing protein